MAGINMDSNAMRPPDMKNKQEEKGVDLGSEYLVVGQVWVFFTKQKVQGQGTERNKKK